MDPSFRQSEIQPNLSEQPWNEVWLKALTQPSVESYEDIVSRPGISTRKAYTWIFLSSLVGSVLTMIGVVFLGSLSTLGADQAPEAFSGLGFTVGALVCAAPVGGLLAVLGLMISAGISQAIASALGGEGTFEKLAYAISAYASPLGIVTSLLSLVPIVNCLSLPVGLYGIFLNILAVKSVHRFSWGKAIASSVAVIALILILIACLIIGVLALMGPAIGSVFSNIIQEMGTPMP
jgi:hypothetical protein